MKCGGKYLFTALLALGVVCLYSRMFAEEMVRVELVLNSPAKTDYQLFYQEQDGFDEQHSIHMSNRTMGKREKLVFKLPAKEIKGMRLDFGDGSSPNPIVLGSVHINGKALDLSAVARKSVLHDMSMAGEDGNGLALKVNSPDPFLVFPADMVQAHSKQFYDWMPLWSIFILSFILFYAFIFKYFSVFWAEKDMREGLAFLVIIAILLLLPMSQLNMAAVDANEKRALAPFPNFWVQGELNVDFGKQFETWLNDRFAGRRIFVSIHDHVDRFLNGGNYENDKAFEGREHWLFYKGESSVELFQNKQFFSPEQLAQIRDNLEKQQNWLNMHGIASYVFIAPNKEDVYSEYYKPGIHKVRPDDRIVELQRYLADNKSSVDINYPLDMLLSHKDDGLLYWRTDTHWNEYGAYLAYQSIMGRIAMRFFDVDMLTPDKMDFGKASRPEGDLSVMLGIRNAASFDDEQYIVPTPKTGNYYSIVSQEMKNNMPFKIRTINLGKKYKVVVFRDSFSTSLLPYLSESFGEVVYVWDHDMNLYGDFILQEKPDIVLHEIVSRAAGWMLQGTPNWTGGK